jgi:hypothetical protein
MSGFSSHSFALFVVTLLFALLNASVVFAAPWGSPFYQPSGTHIVCESRFLKHSSSWLIRIFLALSVQMKVPDVPKNFGFSDTIFIWPAIQPGTGLRDGDPHKIGNGVSSSYFYAIRLFWFDTRYL